MVGFPHQSTRTLQLHNRALTQHICAKRQKVNDSDDIVGRIENIVKGLFLVPWIVREIRFR